ncbi:endo alpha-1,4 polygalactosaminidase [Ureibacillus sinduriensis]|uniref:endo alpha-1,4 polygalactosaminidase n=2 Tax=Ureibacillus sinduriensis TaxID=561440 RepID=UPI00068C81B8|nr:endo alpha-1,4 polygalactosaminidase [Ureibacillus sinduriensis]
MQRHIMSIFAILLLIMVAVPVQAKGATSTLTEVKDFSIYYGWPSKEKLKELRSYDLVVIAPHAYSKEQIDYLQADGTVVLGYISVMQLESWNLSFVSNVQESDYYLQDGQKVYIKQWDTYLMDIRKEHYRQLLVDHVNKDIVSKGMDGVFLDTVDDIDYYLHERDEEQDEFRTAYQSLLVEIKKQDSSLLLMQNRGFDTLKTGSEHLVDALLWESFNYSKLKDSSWGQKWIQYLAKKNQVNELAVFSTVTDNESAQYSEKFKFTSFTKVGNSYD